MDVQPSPDGTPANARRVQAVVHALDVIEALFDVREGLSLAEVARAVHLSHAGAYQLLTTLADHRYVSRDSQSQRYRLNWRLYELGASVVRSASLDRAAGHALDVLAETTGESALLGILDVNEVLYIARSDPPFGFSMSATAGRRSPLHATASGKVLLANSPDRAFVRHILEGPLPRLTPSTIVTSAELRRQLAEARRIGYAACWQESDAGLCSVAVPLRNYESSVIASLAIAGPDARLNSGNFRQYLPALQAAARDIERQLGGHA